MVELRDVDAKSGRCPDISHTFIIEIDRRGSQGEKDTAVAAVFHVSDHDLNIQTAPATFNLLLGVCTCTPAMTD